MIIPEIKLKEGVFSSFYEGQIRERITSLYKSFYANKYSDVIGLACELLEGLLKAAVEKKGVKFPEKDFAISLIVQRARKLFRQQLAMRVTRFESLEMRKNIMIKSRVI